MAAGLLFSRPGRTLLELESRDKLGATSSCRYVGSVCFRLWRKKNDLPGDLHVRTSTHVADVPAGLWIGGAYGATSAVET